MRSGCRAGRSNGKQAFVEKFQKTKYNFIFEDIGQKPLHRRGGPKGA
jgi:hypothetical protein